MEGFGHRMDHAFRYRRTYAANRYEHAFGIFGPLIASVVGFIVLVVVITVLNIMAPTTPHASEVAGFLQGNLIIFFGLMIVGGYTTYAARKYPAFRWVAPIVSAGIFYIVYILIGRFLIQITASISNVGIDVAVSEFNFLAIPLTLLILVLGYLGVIGSMYWHESRYPPRCPRDVQPPSYTPSPPQTPPQSEGKPPFQ
jgi:hypothetical protein